MTATTAPLSTRKLPGGPDSATRGRPAIDAVAKLPSAIGDQQAPESATGPTLRWSLPVLRLVAIGLLAAGAAVLAWTIMPLAWGWTPAVIVSGSMSPRVHRGDVVISSPPGPDWHPAVGQVVTVPDQVHRGNTLTHRIVGFDEHGLLLTRGDANGSNDPFRTAPENVHGIGRLLVPRIGLATLEMREGRPAMFVLQALTVLTALGLVLRLPAHPDNPAESEASPQEPAAQEPAAQEPAEPKAAPQVPAKPKAAPAEAEPQARPVPKRPVNSGSALKHPGKAQPKRNRKPGRGGSVARRVR
ncbi:hypothetical protein [Krasilnikovia sp. MM14-A1259]|uniref:S26 family signal peptidase n=1 Tax=Krasilnikovia sp. MM14-A1259 TaxID=3373539 RepID=UPI0037F9BF1E